MPHFPKPFFRPSRNQWYVQVDGKQVNLGPDRDAALDRYHALMAAGQSKAIVADSAPSESLVAIIDAFLEWLHKNRSPDTYEWYRYRLERFARKHPKMLAADLKPYHVQQWVDGYELSVTSRRNYLRTVKRCLRWAVRQGYLDKNPIGEMEVPAAERREAIVSANEYAEILAAVTDDDFRDLLVVTWETGCRPQESLRAEGRHLDATHRRLVFPKSESKNKKLSRVVYLTERAFEICVRRMAAHPSGKLFRNSAGRVWSTEAVNCAFRRVRVKLGRRRMREQRIEIDEAEIARFMATLKREKTERGAKRAKTPEELRSEAVRKLTQRKACALVPNYSLYSFRHAWATNALQRGVDPLTVAILMGHSDPSTLARVYQHLSLNPDHLRSQLAKAASPADAVP